MVKGEPVERKYESWKLRKRLYKESNWYHLACALILVEDIDWNTGTKTFKSKIHYYNWLSRLANKYEVGDYLIIEGDQVIDTIDVLDRMRYAVRSMYWMGLASLEIDPTTGTRTLTLLSPQDQEKEEAGDE